MKVLVLGAGVVGVTTAWYLARAGHTVAVVDRQPEPAGETSYANAGLLTPSDALSWAAPSAPLRFARSLLHPEWGVRVVPTARPSDWAWYGRFLAQCPAERHRANSRTKLDLATRSLALLEELIAETGIAFDHARRGVVYAYETEATLRDAFAGFGVLRDLGWPLHQLDRAELLALEPAFAHSTTPIAGAIHSPGCQTGDCRRFTQALADLCRATGRVTFHLGETIGGLTVTGGRVTGATTDRARHAADAVVLSLGCQSRDIGAAVGLDVPILPVKGYSVTYRIKNPAGAPAMGGANEDRFIAFCRLGDRLRLACKAEFGGRGLTGTAKDFAMLSEGVEQMFPGVVDHATADFAARTRPMTPSSTPLIGPSGLDGLYYNTGHGHLGWTLACASAERLLQALA
ncbi:FAD-dependent oxidoreductase [Caenispirillum bisanense]|uniref:Glycine oxidase n=1 Tax=Caenispirillum bisanense TaxID=414052 RepID=A0A286GRX9_9PROT|nr:FAD-dependent oxidoreductase [Caenispirillum bisanense]SOD98293.1 glycine oxidase [Caenispirillum bisanense]